MNPNKLLILLEIGLSKPQNYTQHKLLSIKYQELTCKYQIKSIKNRKMKFGNLCTILYNAHIIIQTNSHCYIELEHLYFQLQNIILLQEYIVVIGIQKILFSLVRRMFHFCMCSKTRGNNKYPLLFCSSFPRIRMFYNLMILYFLNQPNLVRKLNPKLGKKVRII